jgi:hypothetical protein
MAELVNLTPETSLLELIRAHTRIAAKPRQAFHLHAVSCYFYCAAHPMIT